MKRHWTTQSEDKRLTYHLEIEEEKERIFSWETTGHWKSEMGGYMSFEDFLKGEWDEWITKAHGKEVLKEAKDNVKIISTT